MQILGIMPLPYSRTYEGFATAIYEQLSKVHFNMAYARGAVGRIHLVEAGTYQFAVVYGILNFSYMKFLPLVINDIVHIPDTGIYSIYG